MATYNRIRRQQLLREAEGYLDLAMVLAERFPIRRETRDRISMRSLETLKRLEPPARESSLALLLRGQAFRLMERYDEAVLPLQKASELDPENEHIYLALGWCYKRLGKIDRAIQALEEALARDQQQAIIHYNLACYWSLANNVGLALVYLAQAFDLDSDYREMVQDEPDFDPVRNHPEFVALTSVIV